MKNLLFILLFASLTCSGQSILGGATGSSGVLAKGTGTAGLLAGGYGANVPPTANAGSNQAITLPTATATLTGSGTGNAGATISSYAWSQLTGTSATITSPTASTTTITGLSTAGVRTFQLLVTDNHGLTGTSSVSVTVNASAGHDSAMFNVSLNSTSGGTGWTNVFGDPSISVRTASVTNGATTFAFSTVATANWTKFSGACAFANNGVNTAGFFPAAVTFQNYYQAYSGTFHDSVHNQVSLSGLDPAKLYTISVSGSNQFTNPSTSEYYLWGSASPSTYGFQVLANYNNSANGTTFLHVAPDGTGLIKFFFVPYAGVSSNLGQFNGVKIVTE